MGGRPGKCTSGAFTIFKLPLVVLLKRTIDIVTVGVSPGMGGVDRGMCFIVL